MGLDGPDAVGRLQGPLARRLQLVAAGFRSKLADTPEREQRLRALPPLKMVSQSKDGHLVYRYADPYSCDLEFPGKVDTEIRAMRGSDEVVHGQANDTGPADLHAAVQEGRRPSRG